MADGSVIGGTRQELTDVLIGHSTRSMLEMSSLKVRRWPASSVMEPTGILARRYLSPEYASDRFGDNCTYVGRDATLTNVSGGQRLFRRAVALTIAAVEQSPTEYLAAQRCPRRCFSLCFIRALSR